MGRGCTRAIDGRQERGWPNGYRNPTLDRTSNHLSKSGLIHEHACLTNVDKFRLERLLLMEIG
jgi:hypothetical protein